ncbi:MAG TPA: pseudouridine synthase [Xanthobacteraceae bacterium]|nr:pseudouridine synthase [Xanthobacteraceae bacterium]
MDNGAQHKSGERIAKVIARAGLTSRREAEAWIAAGRVAVNGAVIASAALDVTERDRISVDGEPLRQPERTRLFLYHKPRGLLTTHADPRGRPTIFAKLPAHLPRLISVGRLDFNTEGLLLLTNDGALARVLELPATGWLRRYRVRAHGSVTQAELDALRTGVTISGIHYGPIEAALDRVQGSNLWLTFAIREGKNREVRNVLAHLGLTVTRLIRLSFGPFRLGELAEGAVEEVRTRTLREQLGDKLIAQAGADFSSAPASAAPSARPAPPAKSGPGAARGGKQPGQPAGRGKPQQSFDHAWRAHDGERPGKKLHRKYRGTRGDAEPRTPPAAEVRSGRLQDRKGREVVVERWGSPPKAEPPEEPRAPRRSGRRRSPDRAGGPRPRQPRGRR